MAICRKDDGCAKTERCFPVYDAYSQAKEKKVKFRVCRRATLAAGVACSLLKPPFCGRGLSCFRRRCVQPCGPGLTCPKGQTCSAKAYLGSQAFERKNRGARPDFVYCAKSPPTP